MPAQSCIWHMFTVEKCAIWWIFNHLWSPNFYLGRYQHYCLSINYHRQKTDFLTGEFIIVSFTRPSFEVTLNSWLSITYRGYTPPSAWAVAVCMWGNLRLLNSGLVGDSIIPGRQPIKRWLRCDLSHNNDGYSVVAGTFALSVSHPGGDPVCVTASTTPSTVWHMWPQQITQNWAH